MTKSKKGHNFMHAILGILCTLVKKGKVPVDGSQITNPSDVGANREPKGAPFPGTGRSKAVWRLFAMSENSGISQAIGLGITMPTLGKLPQYLSEMRTHVQLLRCTVPWQ